MPNIEKGTSSDSMYVQLSDEPVSYSVELSPDIIIDVTEDNTVVGIDIQYVSEVLERVQHTESPAAANKLDYSLQLVGV